MLRRSFARSKQLQQRRAQLRLPVGQRVRLCWLGGLGRPESRQHQASEDHFVFPLVTVRKTMSTSFRRSSMRKWRNGTFFHSVLSSPSLLRNKQITSVSTLMSLSRLCTTVIGLQGSAEGFIASSVFDAYLPVQRWRKSQR